MCIRDRYWLMSKSFTALRPMLARYMLLSCIRLSVCPSVSHTPCNLCSEQWRRQDRQVIAGNYECKAGQCVLFTACHGWYSSKSQRGWSRRTWRHLFQFLSIILVVCVILRLAPSRHQWADFDDLCNASYDVFPRKEVPIGGLVHNALILGVKSPKNYYGSVKRHFQA